MSLGGSLYLTLLISTLLQQGPVSSTVAIFLWQSPTSTQGKEFLGRYLDDEHLCRCSKWTDYKLSRTKCKESILLERGEEKDDDDDDDNNLLVFEITTIDIIRW